MIAPLRRRHYRLWLALAVALPVILAVALAARRPALMMEKLPEVLTKDSVP
jgi:hypothetical protein